MPSYIDDIEPEALAQHIGDAWESGTDEQRDSARDSAEKYIDAHFSFMGPEDT